MEDIEEINGMTKNLKATKKFAHVVVGIVILEFGSTLSLKSYIVIKEAHFNKMITETIKSMEEGPNQSSNLVRTKQISSARLPLEPHLMPTSTKNIIKLIANVRKERQFR
jgi:hypothetical protein